MTDYRRSGSLVSGFLLLLMALVVSNPGCGPSPTGEVVVSREMFADDEFIALRQIQAVDIPVEGAVRKTIAVLTQRESVYYDAKTREKILSLNQGFSRQRLVYSRNENKTLRMKRSFDPNKRENLIIIDDFHGLHPPRLTLSLLRCSSQAPMLATDLDNDGHPEFYVGMKPYRGKADSVKCFDHLGNLKWSLGSSDEHYPSLWQMVGYVSKEDKGKSFIATMYNGKGRKELIQIIDFKGEVKKLIYSKHDLRYIDIVELGGKPYIWGTLKTFVLGSDKFILLDLNGNVVGDYKAPRLNVRVTSRKFHPFGPKEEPYICVLSHFKNEYDYTKLHILTTDGELLHTEILASHPKLPMAIYDLPGSARQGILAGNENKIFLYTIHRPKGSKHPLRDQ